MRIWGRWEVRGKDGVSDGLCDPGKEERKQGRKKGGEEGGSPRSNVARYSSTRSFLLDVLDPRPKG